MTTEPQPVDYDAAPDTVASRWSHLAFRKLTACMASVQPVNYDRGLKLDLADRIEATAHLGDDATDVRRQFESLECFSSLVPGLIAFSPAAMDDVLMTGTNLRSNRWVIFASVNPQWSEIKAKNKGKEPAWTTQEDQHGPRLQVALENVPQTEDLIDVLKREGAVKFLYIQLFLRKNLTSNQVLLEHSKNLLAVLKEYFNAPPRVPSPVDSPSSSLDKTF
ncbi:hypothetical protein K4K56_006682 [Colletotrichum sp. SAR 10_98]|nr:hypothetical protein K4K56_006682 [Colletotrichum sp. SAR 10_98]